MIKRLMIPSIVLFIITCSIFCWYYHIHRSIIPNYQKNLSQMTNARINEITEFLNIQEKYAIQLSYNSAIIEALQSNSSEQLTQNITFHQENMQFKNILLINRNGKIIFSTTKDNLIGIDIAEHTNSSLGKSYERATMSLTNDFSNFNFNELLQEPALFITIPILKEKRYVGALIYQLDEERIYRITNQYIGLGKTGEVVLGKKNGEYIVFLYPTRNDPDVAFKKRKLVIDQTSFLQTNIFCQEGSGIILDYRAKKVVSAWDFIPILDWEILVKIDLDEILETTLIWYKIFLFFFILFVISLLLNTYLFWEQIRKKIIAIYTLPSLKKIPSLCKNPLFILLILFLCLTIKNIIECQWNKYSAIQIAKEQAIKINETNADNVSKLLEKVTFLAQSIAKDLQSNYLNKDDIKTRIERDTAENKIITSITVAYIPYGYDSKTQFHIQTTSLDGMPAANVLETKWYTQALQKNVVWIINPIKDTSNLQTATYACTFLDKHNKQNGVIAVSFSLPILMNALEPNNVGKTGYSIITTDTGIFISHPIASLVADQTTLLEFAQASGNEELARIAQKTLHETPLIASYQADTTKELFWIATQSIPTNKWIIGTVFSEEEVGFSPHKVRHYYFWILLWLIITLLLLISLLYSYMHISEMTYIVLINIILLSGIIFAWYTITITYTLNRDLITVITDQSNLDKFLNDLNEEADRKHEQKPINIPCGLVLYSLGIPDPDHIEISGYLWTKYNNTTEHKNIAHGIDILQSTRMTIGKPLTSIANQEETETWTVQGILSQEQQNAHYPFDQQRLRIALEHRDIEKNIILTPDLSGYKKVSPESTPGLDKNFSISGFTVEQTFFEYKYFDPKVNFGFKEYGKVTDHFQLIYNVILNRNLLNPFVLYILPLLVILFSLFCTLLIGNKKTNPFSMLGPYTGLFFSLIILQRSLREQHPSGSTLYMEYAFFYTYITIILLILHTILNHFYKHKTRYQDKAFHLIKLLFWPFQFITWLITTLVVFY